MIDSGAGCRAVCTNLQQLPPVHLCTGGALPTGVQVLWNCMVAPRCGSAISRYGTDASRPASLARNKQTLCFGNNANRTPTTSLWWYIESYSCLTIAVGSVGKCWWVAALLVFFVPLLRLY